MKEVKTGQRVMIQKNDDFVFVTKLPTQATLLEFDNGRNLFLSGDLTDENALREIVYALRDDGKEIYEGFFYPAPGQNEESLARAISLIQPKNALIVQAEVNSSPVMNESTLRAALKDELYEGPMAILNDKQNIPF